MKKYIEMIHAFEYLTIDVKEIYPLHEIMSSTLIKSLDQEEDIDIGLFLP